jgi:LacI family transcriptional regulator
MRATLRDVAKASGVSVVAVSNVLHGTGQSVRVSQETAERVRNIAKELSYQPNTIARSLRSSRTFMVGVVFQHFYTLSDDNPYHPQLLSGVMAALFPKNYSLALCPKLVQRGETGAISDGRFDGILWARPDLTEASVESLKRSHVPLVMMHASPGALPGIPTFSIDNEKAMQMVVRHLFELGHQHIAFVADLVNQHTTEGVARASAFLAAAKTHGIQAKVWFWDESDPSLARYLSEEPFLTAMACFSDMLAGHLLIACRRLGIAVPRELSVVGFDSSTFCDKTDPPLTSMRQEVERIAFDATNHLLALIQGEIPRSDWSAPHFELYPCQLDVRASTDIPSQQKLPL